MTALRRLSCTLLIGIGLGLAAQVQPAPRYEAQYPDPEPFDIAWAQSPAMDLNGVPVTGLTVPHHLVAADLIATGFRAAAESGMRPTRIVVLVPDHFKRAGRPFATTRRGFETAYGRIEVDRPAVETLLRSRHFEASDLFAGEHGLGALLPFVRRAFPGVPIVPVAVALRSQRRQWEAAAGVLLPWIGARTLVVQSTDFSHYLSRREAIAHDQQTLNVLASADLDALARLHQPRHLDSRGAQYLQLALQQRRFGAQPIIVANANSADYGATGDGLTTSYLVQLYAAGLARRVVHAPGQASRSLCFAGDTFFGRHVQTWLARPRVRARLLAAWRDRLRDCPLVVNLEGVIATHGSEGRGPRDVPQLPMPRKQTLQWLRDLNVVAVGLANNHTLDLGEVAYAQMVHTLREAGIEVLEHGEGHDVAGVRIVALRDLDNPPRARNPLVGDAEIASVQALANDRRAPVVALMHWGREFDAKPGPRESDLAERLHEAGAGWIIGAHPHRASAGPLVLRGGRALEVHSLGNFVFDQHVPLASGAVLQLSCFAQGTCAARWIAMPGIFELGRR